MNLSFRFDVTVSKNSLHNKAILFRFAFVFISHHNSSPQPKRKIVTKFSHSIHITFFLRRLLASAVGTRQRKFLTRGISDYANRYLVDRPTVQKTEKRLVMRSVQRSFHTLQRQRQNYLRTSFFQCFHCFSMFPLLFSMFHDITFESRWSIFSGGRAEDNEVSPAKLLKANWVRF